MRVMQFTTNDEDLARILEAVESDAKTKMDSVGKSTDMHLRGHVHTHCAHLDRIAAEIRALITP